MTIYNSRLTRLICSCTELSTEVISPTLSPDWDNLVRSVDEFFKYYNLSNTREYRSFADTAKNLNVVYGIGMRNTPDKAILTDLLDLRKYENSVPKYFDKVFISHSSKDVGVVQPFVELLVSIRMTNKNLFCSSVNGYGFDKIQGAADSQKIGFGFDKKYRLDEFYANLLKKLRLTPTSN